MFENWEGKFVLESQGRQADITLTAEKADVFAVSGFASKEAGSDAMIGQFDTFAKFDTGSPQRLSFKFEQLDFLLQLEGRQLNVVQQGDASCFGNGVSFNGTYDKVS